MMYSPGSNDTSDGMSLDQDRGNLALDSIDLKNKLTNPLAGKHSQLQDPASRGNGY